MNRIRRGSHWIANTCGDQKSVGRMGSPLYLAVCIVILAAVPKPVKSTAEVMSHVTAHFGKSLEECREESGLTAEVLEEFQHFWSEDFEVVHRELGCALICMSNKFSLMQDDARMHHVNMHDYVKSFPQGDLLSAKMVEMIHNCEKQYDDITDDCNRVVKVAACFKESCKKAGIAPEVAMIEAVMEQY
ncbi:general odorant-binding protein 2-like [Vanessa tameamea]|uniref:General odorant-binding protein 2-like n=1 Tax=Vanessa tameamea TaxID=334116 RepID=A0A8B8I1K0_VANTA|nr:general odorant-binding protein 2-like [Vanessa tameamea]